MSNPGNSVIPEILTTHSPHIESEARREGLESAASKADKAIQGLRQIVDSSIKATESSLAEGKYTQEVALDRVQSIRELFDRLSKMCLMRIDDVLDGIDPDQEHSMAPAPGKDDPFSATFAETERLDRLKKLKDAPFEDREKIAGLLGVVVIVAMAVELAAANKEREERALETMQLRGEQLAAARKECLDSIDSALARLSYNLEKNV